MIDNRQLRSLIIQPVLKGLSLYSLEAEDLLVGTCAQETLGISFLMQKTEENYYDALKRNLFALGIYQMEPRTHDDIWKSYLPAHPKLSSDLMQVCCFSRLPSSHMLVYNLFYATAMARIFYKRAPEPIPKTLELQAEYYKTYWNTSQGAATVEQYISNYNRITGKKVEKK
jgi:hypothetical protein